MIPHNNLFSPTDDCTPKLSSKATESINDEGGTKERRLLLRAGRIGGVESNGSSNTSSAVKSSSAGP